MRRACRFLWAPLVACLLLVALADGGVLAISAGTAANGNSSCVWTADAVGTWTNGTTRTYRVKCYYSGGFSAPAGSTAWFDGDTADVTGQAICLYESAGVIFCPLATGTSGFTWSNYVEVVNDAALDYFEISVDVKRWSGTTKTQSTGTFGGIFADATGAPAPFDKGTGGVNSTYVAPASFDTTDPTYYYGSGPWSPLLPFCHGTTVVLDSPTTDTTVIVQGDTVHTAIDLGSVAGTEVQMRMPGGQTSPPSPNNETWHEARSATYSGADPADYDFVVGRMFGSKQAQYLQVRCREPGEQWVTRLVTETGEGVVGDDELDRPCKTMQIFAPEAEQVEEGDTTDWGVRYSAPVIGDPTILDLEVRQGPAAFNSDPAVYGSWVSVDTNIEPPHSDSYAVVALQSGDVDNFFHWRCTDAQGIWYVKAAVIVGGGFPGVVGVPDDSLAGCVQGSFGLNPSSWAPALINAGSCTVIFLVVPSDDAVDSLAASATAITERAPISYVAEVGPDLVGTFTGAPAAVTAHRDDALVLMPSGLIEDLPAQSIAPADLDGSTQSTARSIIGVCAWVTFAWMLWQMTRRLIST